MIRLLPQLIPKEFYRVDCGNGNWLVFQYLGDEKLILRSNRKNEVSSAYDVLDKYDYDKCQMYLSNSNGNEKKSRIRE